MMIFGTFITIAVIILVIYYAGLFDPEHLRKKDGSSHGSALEVLKKRYASGEISRDEFQTMKDEITRSA